MTSIEWLVEQLWNYSEPSLTNKILIDKAKEMHKQEIIDAFKSGLKSPYHQDYTFVTQDNQEGTKSAQYYQETFVSKGSDEVELPKQDVDKLGNENVPKLGYDVEKLAYDYASKELNRPIEIYKVLEVNVAEYKSFINGYLKAKETLYTEEQLDKAISWGINSVRKGDVTITDIDNFIQSLKQPKKD